MRALRDADVHLDDAEMPYITVRYGKPPTKPTKSGLVREIPLLPMAQRALREWYELRQTHCTGNDKRLTFPAERGGYRSEGKMLGRRHGETWKQLLADAGVHRHLVWHDLRHTCGTALLGGYFGRKWSLEEIQQFLGHADIETTQRYAHALQTTLTDAARETPGDITPKKKATAA
jgi:integrase